MNETMTWGLAGLAGAALGALFFGGLWWTVRRGLASSQPALWLFGSLLLRMGATLAGFYAVGGGDWRRLLACLLGFVAARLLALRLGAPQREAVHAA
ncbi:MAG TPA: ATP synthase subunit I [Janthinobacterium sp.]|nr:ATP synthase subunit I [Janthinobacterium sp.]